MSFLRLAEPCSDRLPGGTLLTHNEEAGRGPVFWQAALDGLLVPAPIGPDPGRSHSRTLDSRIVIRESRVIINHQNS